MKKYIHHPKNVPIKTKKVNDVFCPKCHKPSINGMSFKTTQYYEKDSVLSIIIIIEEECFNAYAKVEKIKNLEDEYEIFVNFSEETNPFRIKMVQQLCQIIDYAKRKNIKKEIAAKQWVEQNAHLFENGYS